MRCEDFRFFAAIRSDSSGMVQVMDQMLRIPEGLKRKRTLMLPVLLGLTVLLYVLVLMPETTVEDPPPVETSIE